MAAASRPVTVVTDSTADLPREIAESAGIEVVPLRVQFGDRSFLDGVEMDQAMFLRELAAASELPKTSQPTTADFERVFAAALDAARDVVCVTLSQRLSGTYNAARMATETANDGRIHLVDSGTLTMQLGWIAVAAARAAQSGAGAPEVVKAAEAARSRTALYAVLQTLDYAYKGGRIGRAAELVGTALKIKPILTVRDGEVLPVARVPTWRKALRRMVELTQSHAPISDLAILHAGNPDDAARLVDELAPLVPAGRLVVTEAGPVITTYAGPGAVGVALL